MKHLHKLNNDVTIFLGIALLAVLLATTVIKAYHPAVTEPYRCENRGGIKQAIADKYGIVESYICEDGGHYSDRTTVRDGYWDWPWW